MESYGLISDQFGFRSKYETTEQIHRIIKGINNDMEAGIMLNDLSRCLASFRQDLVSRTIIL